MLSLGRGRISIRGEIMKSYGGRYFVYRSTTEYIHYKIKSISFASSHYAFTIVMSMFMSLSNTERDMLLDRISSSNIQRPHFDRPVVSRGHDEFFLVDVASCLLVSPRGPCDMVDFEDSMGTFNLRNDDPFRSL